MIYGIVEEREDDLLKTTGLRKN